MSSVRENYANADYAEEQHQKLLDQEQEEARAKADHAVTRAELERRREERQQEQTYPIMVEGLPVEMRTPPAKVQVRALRMNDDGTLEQLDEIDEEADPSDVDLSAATNVADFYIDCLAEYSVEPSGLDREFWAEYHLLELKDYFVEWLEAAPEEDRVSGFRSES